MTILLALFLLANQDPEALSAKALGLAEQRRTEEAEALWKEALRLKPDLFSAAFNLGFLYYSRKDCKSALPYLTQAVALQKSDFNAHYLSGVCLSQAGRTDDALRRWRVALSARPNHATLMQIMAVEYSKGGYYREAAAIAERALALRIDDPSIVLLAIRALADAGDHAAAEPLATKLAARLPDDPRANFECGFILHRLGRSAEALPYLEKATRAPQPWEEPFFFYAEVLLQQNRREEAASALRKAIELRPDYMAARVSLARVLMSLGKDEEAKTVLVQAVARDPRHPQPHLVLSQLLFRLGDESGAAQEKALSLKLRREKPETLEQQPSRPFAAQEK